jgi:hypothetical protein
VPAAERQAAAGQAGVEVRRPERQGLGLPSSARLKGGDLRPHGVEAPGAKIGHGFQTPFVLILF